MHGMALPILYTLSLLLHGLVAWRLLPALDPAWAAGLAPVLLASALLLPMGLLAHRVARGALADRLAWVGLLCMGLFSSLLVLTALRDVLLAAVWVAATLGWSPAQALLPGLRADSALVVPLVALLVTVLGFWNARRTARVVRVDVPVAALPCAGGACASSTGRGARDREAVLNGAGVRRFDPGVCRSAGTFARQRR